MRRPIEIREVRSDDLHALFLLGSACISSRESMNMLTAWNERNLAGVLAEDISRSFIAVRKKSVEGFLIGRIDSGGRAEIIWTCARGMEAAVTMTELYRAFVGSIPDSVSVIRVALPGSNTEMIDFLGKFGFTDSEQVVIMENFFRKKS
jgi:hypothetical protein